jgi:hypothetical protein
VKLPASYISLCGLALASEIAYSLYSDTIFTDGLRAQTLRKLEEMKKIHQFEYNIEDGGSI